MVGSETCCRLGFPVADEKTVGPATLITFLSCLQSSKAGEEISEVFLDCFLSLVGETT